MEVYQQTILVNPTDLYLDDSPCKDYKYWSSSNTRILIDRYANLIKKVGTLEIRNMKKLWEIIATEMRQITNENITPTNCENRWKVLERNYKAHVNNNKKTGRRRKVFEFSIEMDEIFAKKKNVKPEILLETEAIDNNRIEEISLFENYPENIEKEINETPKKITRKSNLKKKKSILQKIRQEKKEYYQKKLNIESERLQVEKEKLKEMKRRNDLLEERNNILKNSDTVIRSESLQ